MTPSDDEDLKMGPETEGFGDETLIEDFEGGGKDAGARGNPMVKVGLVVGAVAAVVGALILFGGKKETPDISIMRSGSTVTSTPGAENVPEEYRKAVEETNKEAVEEAARTGGSALPVPIAPPVGRVQADESLSREVEDPLARWRRIQEERQKRDEMQRKKKLTQVDPNAEAINKLSQVMSTQMTSILDGRDLVELQTASILSEKQYFDDLEKDREDAEKKLEEKRQKELEKQQQQQQQGGGYQQGGTGEADVVNIIIPAATIEYAQLMIEANSDTPGPVMAQVMSGPLAGSRLLGSFAAQQEHLTIEFKTVVVDGISHSINAIALDPDTTLPGMVTEIDHRYFERIVLPAAASFVEGISSAIAETGGTTVNTTVPGGVTVANDTGNLSFEEEVFRGVEEAGKTISNIIDDDVAGIKPMIKVAAGTPMGVLFLEPVTDENL